MSKQKNIEPKKEINCNELAAELERKRHINLIERSIGCGDISFDYYEFFIRTPEQR